LVAKFAGKAEKAETLSFQSRWVEAKTHRRAFVGLGFIRLGFTCCNSGARHLG
jgi:hypothetical protein